MVRRARPASACGSRSPAIIALIMSWADSVVSLLATDDRWPMSSMVGARTPGCPSDLPELYLLWPVARAPRPVPVRASGATLDYYSARPGSMGSMLVRW